MKIGIPVEAKPGERRVALVPRHVSPLAADGNEILVQSSAGLGAGFTDDEYRAAGASLVQLYTGFIYRGPQLIADARRALRT